MGKTKKPLLLTRTIQRDQSTEWVAQYLNDLDLLAIAIHRLYWSGNPKLVNNGTVAVVKVDDEYWYAVNVLAAPTPDEVVIAHAFVSTSGESITPYYVYLDEGEGDDNATHAEMKLLYQLDQEGKSPEGDRMGISKPACQYCAATLKKNGIGYSWTHDRQVVTWEYPNISKKKLVIFKD